MGDRANVVVSEGPGNVVWLYTHWRGSGLPHTLQQALLRRERWDDGPYLARIVFCEMVGDTCRDTTGFGISSVCGDGNGHILMLSVPDQTVAAGYMEDDSFQFVCCGKWTFRDFTELSAEKLDEIWDTVEKCRYGER